jgi:hypothetical protein
MICYDVFNGDADGLCSLHQLRLDAPRDAVLVTGVKRDIVLLPRVPARAGDRVTVCDISLDANRAGLTALLDCGARIEYYDHHHAGAIPSSPQLVAHIDTASDMCTATIVDRILQGRHRPWAIVAAFGDNLAATAQRLAGTLSLRDDETRALRDLGDDLAYNAYGDTEADLVIAPADLYRLLRPYESPFAFLAQETIWKRIREVRHDDAERARAIAPLHRAAGATVLRLPAEAWSRRVHGIIANELATRDPECAHAVLTENADGSYLVSVRAPLARPHGAGDFCRGFEGGGRAGAGGVNALAPTELDRFVAAFAARFRAPGA